MTHQSSPKSHSYLDSSSLDPLATSIGDGNVDPSTCIQSSQVRLPCSSPGKALRIVEDMSFSSPHRANRRSSNAPNSSSRKVSYQNLSPWKIRVTVEAEPEEMGISTGRNTTITTKVPLKEDSSSTELVRGRRRTSQTTSSGTKRRSTPVRGTRNSSISRRPSVTDLDITVLGDEEDLNEWSPRKSKKKGRSRSKRSQKERDKQLVPDAPTRQVDDGPHSEKICNISVRPAFDILPDSDAEDRVSVGGEADENSPELRKIDLNRVSLRTKSAAPKGHKSRQQQDNSNSELPAIHPPTIVIETRNADSRTIASGYPTPTSSIQDDSGNIQNVATNGIEKHDGFDTILESEGFTMIDLESIPSARHFMSPPSEQDCNNAVQVETPANNSKDNLRFSPALSMNLPPISCPVEQSQIRPRPPATASYLTLHEGESDLSSTVPSSPPVLAPITSASPSNSVGSGTRLTPEPYSSPRLPSPPRASTTLFRAQIAQTQKSTPPRLVRVVRAGIALQGVLSPKPVSEQSQVKSPRFTQGTPKERLDDLFEGFDSGTRRELRAGLRFGEELAKRQKSSSPVEVEKKPTQTSSIAQVWREETTVRHTPITLSADTSDMFEKRAYPHSSATSAVPKRVKSVDGSSQAGLTTPVQAKCQVAGATYLDTQAKEREWQLEREAVSRQIQNANTSQVIVIDSDGIEEDVDRSSACKELPQCNMDDEADNMDVDETDGDIWLAEAEAHSLSQNQSDGQSPDMFSAIEQARQRERAREVVTKPRRSLIPSPWKRGEDMEDVSTFTTNSDISGLFWKQPGSGAGFGAGAIKRQREGKSDAFGGGSQGTPQRLLEFSDDANSLPTSTHEESVAATDNETTQESLGRDEPRFDKNVLEAGRYSGEEVRTEDPMSESVCEIEDHDESDSTHGDVTEEISIHDSSSLLIEAIKIPVNFNDSTVSAPPLMPLIQSSTPHSSRPNTPRSALKGSRSSLGLEDMNSRKVVFSSQSLCVDESGYKSNLRIKSLSPTPPPSTIPGVGELLQPAPPPPTLSRGKLEGQLEPEPESKSWFGWFFGSSKTSSTDSRAPSSPTAAKSAEGVSGVDRTSDGADADSGRSNTKSNIITSRRNSPRGKRGLPSFLRPPSYPSDPARDVSIPLATSGEFTDVHFRTLHIIYRKSLRRSFHAPNAIRPRLQKMVGEKFTCDEGEYGYFAWEVDQDAVIVLERFMLEVELGWEGKRTIEWKWSEKELCGRLFRIIIGEEVRREQSWRRERDKDSQKEKVAVSSTASA